MARYIDADALKLDIDLSQGASVLDMAISVIRAVNDAPTADVVPKSEVARLLEDFQRSIRADAKVGMSAGEILLHINNMLAELKKKYTEDKI